VEKGPGEAREFFQKWKWLFATEYDLALLKCRVNREKEKRQPGYLDLDDSCEESVSIPERLGEVRSLRDEAKKDAEKKREKALAAGLPPPEEPVVDQNLSELEKFEAELQEQLKTLDRYPDGYFKNEDGTIYSVLIRAPSAGMGEFSSDELFRTVKEYTAELGPQYEGLEIGFAGDIPNAIEQRDALISDMATISIIAVGLILASIILFFRSIISLFQIGFCVTIGCGLAFSVAMGAYGHLNTATSFLGAIIAGNGINYGIVYLARYRELRTQGKERETALLESALSSRKGTWLAALAAGGAYSALLLTSFRGFSEFGLIGGVGMVFCWISTFALLPAQISLTEKVLPKVGEKVRRTLPIPLGFVGRLAHRHSATLLASALILTAAAAYPLKDYLQDPWEYNFSKLGSRASKERGAGQWSKQANKVFQSRGSPMLMLADDMSQVLPLKAEIFKQDTRVTGGEYIDKVETIYDRLGGGSEAVAAKLDILKEIRAEIDEVMPRLKGNDRRIAEEWRPPEYLRPLKPDDLPDLVKSQFTEKNGTIGTALYVYLERGISQSNGHNLLRISEIFESVKLPDDEIAPNASRSTVFAAMIRAMEHDGPLATLIAFLAVCGVTIIVTHRIASVVAILGSLLCGVILTVGGAAWFDVRLNFLNFVALPLTFGIGVEYAINLFERVRVMGSVTKGVSSIGGPVALCSLTTMLGYGALTMADNMALQSFGRYAIAGELACIITAMFMLPAVLVRWGGNRYTQELKAPPGTAQAQS